MAQPMVGAPVVDGGRSTAGDEERKEAEVRRWCASTRRHDSAWDLEHELDLGRQQTDIVLLVAGEVGM